MTKPNGKILFFLILALLSVEIYGQVGINTTTPNGALDINSSTSGFVYPVVALTDVTIQQISNPNPLSANVIVNGTTVYNTNTNVTAIIANSVYPGIYVWNGGTPSKWVPQFSKKDHKIIEQNPAVNRTQSNAGAEAITFVSNSFTPKYTGKYKIELLVHYGGGEMFTPLTGGSNKQKMNFGAARGNFIFNILSTPYAFDLRSFSGINNQYSTKYVNNLTQVSYVIEANLTATFPIPTAYPFTLTFNQENLPEFLNNGNIGSNNNGTGYINSTNDIKCSIEFTYIGE